MPSSGVAPSGAVAVSAEEQAGRENPEAAPLGAENPPPAAKGVIGRAASLSFLAIVAILLVLPLVQTVLPVLGNIAAPLEERRQPTAFPSPALLSQANGDFANGLNAWFDDRVGFRDLFIRSKNQIDYSLFHTSRKVYVGKDGW